MISHCMPDIGGYQRVWLGWSPHLWSPNFAPSDWHLSGPWKIKYRVSIMRMEWQSRELCLCVRGVLKWTVTVVHWSLFSSAQMCALWCGLCWKVMEHLQVLRTVLVPLLCDVSSCSLLSVWLLYREINGPFCTWSHMNFGTDCSHTGHAITRFIAKFMFLFVWCLQLWSVLNFLTFAFLCKSRSCYRKL